MNVTIETDFGNLRYTPGERIRGRVRWDPAPGTSSAHLRLLWFTQGKGDRDVGIAGDLALDQPAAGGERSFEFTAPASPPSFSGRLVSVLWTLELTLEPSHLVHRHDITISPTGEELDLTVHLSDTEARPHGQIAAWLESKFGKPATKG